MGAGEERKRRGSNRGEKMVLEGYGLLASTKWCYGTVASLGGASVYRERIDTQDSALRRRVCGIARRQGRFTRLHVGTHTVLRGGFLGPPHNSAPLSQLRKMSEAMDAAIPK